MTTYHQWMEVVVPASIAGLPALNVPVGFSSAGPADGHAARSVHDGRRLGRAAARRGLSPGDGLARPLPAAPRSVQRGQHAVEIRAAVPEDAPGAAEFLRHASRSKLASDDSSPIAAGHPTSCARPVGDEGRAVECDVAAFVGATSLPMRFEAMTGIRLAPAWPRITVSQCGWLS